MKIGVYPEIPSKWPLALFQTDPVCSSVWDIAGRTKVCQAAVKIIAMDWLRGKSRKSNKCETKILINSGENISAHVIPSGFRNKKIRGTVSPLSTFSPLQSSPTPL